MLNETIEIDCDKEQLETFNHFLTENFTDGDQIIFKAQIRDNRLELLSYSEIGSTKEDD